MDLDVFDLERARMVGSCEQGNDMYKIYQIDKQMHFDFINVILLYSSIVQ